MEDERPSQSQRYRARSRDKEDRDRDRVKRSREQGGSEIRRDRRQGHKGTKSVRKRQRPETQRDRDAEGNRSVRERKGRESWRGARVPEREEREPENQRLDTDTETVGETAGILRRQARDTQKEAERDFGPLVSVSPL